jgi:hypothetical protein
MCVAVSVVLGIPTVKREVQSYLLATLQNLIDSMSEEEAADCLIVVFIAEVTHFKPKLSVFPLVLFLHASV